MKVGTDGVLLGAWCGIDDADRNALDIGTGTGLIALMLAQRSEHNPLRVDAVEIDAGSASEAAANVARSPWPDRICVSHCSVQDFAGAYSPITSVGFSPVAGKRYDLVVSNPPYFSDSLLPPDPSRTAARHSVSLSYKELLGAASGLLSEKGRFCVIIPHEQHDGFLQLASSCDLLPDRLTAVISKPGSKPKRAMMELVRRPYAHVSPYEDELLIESAEAGCYAAEYMSLTSDFYLKF